MATTTSWSLRGESRALAERIPNSKKKIYPDSGHGGIFQYHERFVPAVLEVPRRRQPDQLLKKAGEKTGIGQKVASITIKETR